MNASSNTFGHAYLRRLGPGAYQGRRFIHWTMTVAGRKSGWLGHPAHAAWREALLHTLARYYLAAPIYCLMPDHVHLILTGLSETADQRLAIGFLRRYTASMLALAGASWQKQAYDHVLRGKDLGRDGFPAVVRYVAQNPVRAGLVDSAEAWAFARSIIAGWPTLDWRMPDFWERWWRIFDAAQGL